MHLEVMNCILNRPCLWVLLVNLILKHHLKTQELRLTPNAIIDLWCDQVWVKVLNFLIFDAPHKLTGENAYVLHVLNLKWLLLLYAQIRLFKYVISEWWLNLKEWNFLLFFGFPDKAIIGFALDLLDLIFKLFKLSYLFQSLWFVDLGLAYWWFWRELYELRVEAVFCHKFNVFRAHFLHRQLNVLSGVHRMVLWHFFILDRLLLNELKQEIYPITVLKVFLS